MSNFLYKLDIVSVSKPKTESEEIFLGINYAEMLHIEYNVFQWHLNPDLTGYDCI